MSLVLAILLVIVPAPAERHGQVSYLEYHWRDGLCEVDLYRRGDVKPAEHLSGLDLSCHRSPWFDEYYCYETMDFIWWDDWFDHPEWFFALCGRDLAEVKKILSDAR